MSYKEYKTNDQVLPASKLIHTIRQKPMGTLMSSRLLCVGGNVNLVSTGEILGNNQQNQKEMILNGMIYSER
jgi:hypothetical protein